MLPKMLIRAGSRLIIAASNWPYDGWRKNVDKDGALPQHFGLHDRCARERRRGWTSIIPIRLPDGSGGKSSARRVHAGERDKTHRKKWRVITSALMNRRQ
jgi:hypothetical protein